jgi:uncharacterized membrane protein
MPRHWRCTVCGYIHEGDEPPEFCPVCGADRSLFVPVDGPEPGLFRDLVDNFRLHSVAAHFPCGLLPSCVLFLLAYLVTAHPALEFSVFWLLSLVLAVTPVSLISGLYAWRKHFEGRRAAIFTKKICLALTLLLLGLVATLLRSAHPGLLLSISWRSLLYLACFGGMFGCVVLLGHYGSKLVFQAHGHDQQ